LDDEIMRITKSFFMTGKRGGFLDFGAETDSPPLKFSERNRRRFAQNNSREEHRF